MSYCASDAADVPRYDLAIYRGDAFSRDLLIEHAAVLPALPVPFDTLTPSWAAQWRPSHDSEHVESFAVTAGPGGALQIALTGEQTARIGNGYWDLEMRGPGGPRTLAAGRVTVTLDVTHG